MNLTDDFILKCQAGEPVFLYDICAIFPATLREIIRMDYSVFQSYLGALTAGKPIFEKKTPTTEMLENLTDFQYLLAITQLDAEMNQMVKSAFRFFTHEEVIFCPELEQIIIGPPIEKHILNEEHFYELRAILKKMYFLSEDEEIIILENDSEHVKNLKKQMIKNREKVAKAKRKQQAQQNDNIQFSDLIGSLCINNCGVNMVNVWDLTYYAFHEQLRRMGWRDKFNISNRAALAGAKINKKELKHWIKPIISNN